MGLDNLIWIWSPAEFPNAKDYWVGAKYWFTKKYHKPLILAEVGVSGVEVEKSQWLTNAVQDLPKFPEVKAFV
jgi:hypothetical protein